MVTTANTDPEAGAAPSTVAAVFDTEDLAIAALSALNRVGLSLKYVSVVAPHAPGPAGALVGALMAQGVPEEDARSYVRDVREGATLVTVRADTARQANEAQSLLLANGGANVRRYQRTG
jgi:hypothetical protein